jgi:hypothetical protein
MIEHAEEWLAEALSAASYRKMYRLADAIASRVQHPPLKKAAHNVVKSLEGVVEHPIAPSQRLFRARRHFQHLVKQLEEAVGVPPDPGPGKS